MGIKICVFFLRECLLYGRLPHFIESFNSLMELQIRSTGLGNCIYLFNYLFLFCEGAVTELVALKWLILCLWKKLLGNTCEEVLFQ